jgi:hypothetical protein
MILVTCGLVLVACGESDTGEPFSLNLVYCENPDVAAPSCSLSGYSMADDSALRAKLEGCAAAGCHASGSPNFSLDLSGSVQGALSALTVPGAGTYYLVDDFDPDCSQMLSEVTERPVGAVRMPVTGGFWSSNEIDCFRSYLHEMYPQ